MAEKRRHVRASFQTEVWLGQDGILTHTSETLRDLSESGAFIEAAATNFHGVGIYTVAEECRLMGCPLRASAGG